MKSMDQIKDQKQEIHFDALNTTPFDVELDKQAELALVAAEKEVELDENLFSEDFLLHIKPDSRRNERILSFCLIYAADRSGYAESLEELMSNFDAAYSCQIATNEFIASLVGPVIRDRSELDEQIKPFLKNWKLERLGCCTRLILRMALCELSKENMVPSIVMNEAIELAKLFAEKDAYKFINGILDEIVKKTFPVVEAEK